MSTILFEPHHDDAVLFACYTLLRVQPVVVTVFGGKLRNHRSQEGQAAMVSCDISQWLEWQLDERQPDWNAVKQGMLELDDNMTVDQVFAPKWEPAGHEHHNMVGALAFDVFGGRLVEYATYQRGSGRSKTEHEVIPEDGWPARKFKAMACYTSQINDPQTRPWFSDWDREWLNS